MLHVHAEKLYHQHKQIIVIKVGNFNTYLIYAKYSNI